jgi:ABC-type multidrug transport system ATPase subunit
VTGVLAVTEVSKRYRRRGPTVLDRVDLRLEPATITQLRGSNGGGKSTLLRLLGGVTQPTAGRIDGRPASVGFVPERFPVDLRFTPREYLGWLGLVRGLPRQSCTDRTDALAERLGLAPSALDQPMRDLSKGTTQKVALIQALLPGPGLLLLDEAWTGLDSAAQLALTELVVEQRAAGSVVVFSDHGDRAAGLHPDATYLVGGGILTPVAPVGPGHGPGPAARRIELAGPPERVSELEALPGVRSLDPSPQGGVLVVADAQADAVLATALAAGCSVRSVGAA